MATAFSIIDGVEREVAVIIQKTLNEALTGARKTKKFHWHDPENDQKRDIHAMGGGECVRMFDFGIPIQIDAPFTGHTKDWEVYDVPFTVVYPDQMEWAIRAHSDFHLIKKQLEPTTNALTVSGCALRQMSEKYTVTKNEANGSLYLETSIRIYAEIDT